MTPLDFGENLPSAMGIPGINLNDVTSGMTQMTFQNIRNLGQNGNQPLITNQNDFQIFDNVTKISGRHTFKLGGSVTFRSREILNADTIVGSFAFNNNMTSNCAGTVTGCTVNSNTGFDVASFLLGYATTKTRNMFDANTYTEKRPRVVALRAGRLPRQQQADAQPGPALRRVRALGRDRRPPVELRRGHGHVRGGVRQRHDPGNQRRPLPADLLEGRLGPRCRLRLRRDRQRPNARFAAASACSGTTPPAAPSSSKAQNPPFLQSTALTAAPNTNFSNDPKMLVSAGLPPPPGVDPSRPAAGQTRSIFEVDFRDAYTVNYNVNLQQQLGQNYMVELAYVGAHGRQYLLKGDPNEAPATVGVTNSNTCVRTR
jgi:hypothetical protein